jgi:two-component system phosphate regulon sensor histidine kinase PhoR
VRLRIRLLLVAVALIVPAVLATDVILSSALDHRLTDRIRDELFARLALIEREVERAPAGSDLQALAVELGRSGAARVTIIRADGVVLGDSDVDDVARLESHAGRPEVVAARADGRGASMRYSTTLHKRMLYAAVPFPAGTVRAALPLTEVDDAIAAARWLLVAASALALGVAALVTWGATRRVSRVGRQLTESARRMAGGDLEARTRIHGRDELGALGQALDHLAESLARSLGQLQRERDLASGILAAMQEGLLVLDAEGRVAVVNPALGAMSLVGPDAIGKRPLEVIRNHELAELIRTGGGGEIELRGRRLIVRATRLTPAPGGTLVVFFDVTELRRLETIRRDFVANVSHELRTPVTAIRSASETMAAVLDKDPTAARRFLDIVGRNAERLQELVEDILDLSRIESRQVDLRTEPVELAPALSDSTLGLRERADKKGIALRTEAAPTLRASADRRALQQVLGNLVENAIKYCDRGATVVVRARPRDDRVEIAVADNGPGIESRHLPRLFERFYRVDPGRGRDSGGTGLGLSIVKHLVESMGGRVAVESVPGKGSTFSFTLPAA